MANTNITIYRFKFTDELVTCMKRFVSVHEHDDRHIYKDAWDKWIKENSQLITNERTILRNNGFIGDIYDKMYKSGRYYYRKKSNKQVKYTPRRKYISIQRNILAKMTEHIVKNAPTDNYTPANGYKTFIEENYYMIDKEKDRIFKAFKMNNNDADTKLKKTYKNRYFIYSQ